MSDYKDRVRDEKRELDEKISRLNNFFNGTLFAKLEQEDRILLEEQFLVMNQYSDILKKRIDRFE